MGIVYLACDTAPQKNIAIKLSLGRFVDDAGAWRRFTKGAEAWTGLMHPHIVGAFNVEDDQSLRLVFLLRNLELGRRAGFLRLPMAVPALQSGVKTIHIWET